MEQMEKMEKIKEQRWKLTGEGQACHRRCSEGDAARAEQSGRDCCIVLSLLFWDLPVSEVHESLGNGVIYTVHE
jgi:hypothetical protein